MVAERGRSVLVGAMTNVPERARETDGNVGCLLGGADVEALSINMSTRRLCAVATCIARLLLVVRTFLYL